MKNPYLQKIKDQAKQTIFQGTQNLFVFDLDSTLFDVGPRIQKIIMDFAAEDAHAAKYPIETKLLKNVKVSPSDWGIRSSIEKIPFTSAPPADFFTSIRTFWMEKFFSNDYLNHDEPYDGAVEFLNHLADIPGNNIAYLTGRDVKRMLLGTEASLSQHGFPVGAPNITLALKPNTEISDTDFKCDWFYQIEHLNFANIWFFENEPTNIERVAREHPQVQIIFFDSTHSGKLPSPTDFPTISDYL
jgi:hypothetical protein